MSSLARETAQETVSNSGTLSASILRKIREDAAARGENASGKSVIPSPFLYVVGDVATESSPKFKVVVGRH